HLDRMVSAHERVMRSLQNVDPELCADYFDHGPREGVFARDDARVAAAVSDIALATFDAIADGADKPTADAPVAEDKAAFMSRWTKDMSGVEIAALKQGKRNSLTSGRRCEIGIAFVGAMQALPADARRRVLAFMLTKFAVQ